MSNTGMAYIHGQWRNFVDKREDNGKFTAFMSSKDSITDGMRTEVATIPDFPTFEEAQNALDGYALKHAFSAEGSISDEVPDMEQQTFASDPGESADSVPSADNTPEVGQAEEMNELADQDDLLGTNNDSEDPDNENPPSDNDSGDSENDSDESNGTGEKAESLPDGPTLSLRLPAFDSIFDTADASLRDLARAMKTKLIESGELAIKVVINNYGGVLKPDPKKCKVDCTPKPAKVSTSIRFPADLEIAVEQDGRVIIPEDREHQINFDEIQPGEREYPPDGGTVTVDGQTGLAEHYEGDGEGDEISSDNPTESPQDTPEEGSGGPDFEGDMNAREHKTPVSDGVEYDQK
jgi:hypothetical protein